ncbi:MAG: ATP-binding protein [bacterium]|nr:ATP-binding protein [bacterium]MDZ4284628.1 ATP-binding protein [Patescibacteria group bacterium]
MKTAKPGNGYGADQIQVLEGLEPVRRRPGMYIGTTGPDGLHHLVVEVFDNSRDEAMAGFGGDIELALLPGNRVRVVDNGRGIPVERHPQTKVSTLETVMTTLHAGGKFGSGGYTVSGGLHGVGVSVVNALSERLRAEVHRDGSAHAQEYRRGEPLAAAKRIGASERTGTIITFEPDATVFKDGISFDWKRIVDHMRQQAYLVKGMRITLLDARAYEGKFDDQKVFYLRDLGLDLPSTSFYFEGGLLSLVRFYNQSEKPVHKSIFYIEKEARALGVESVEIAFQYVDDISYRILAFANNTFNGEGGTHLTGFKGSLTRTLNSYARANNLLKEKDENFTGEDVLEGLTAVISVKLREIQFEGQTKAKLGSVEARTALEGVMNEALSNFLEENPDEARAIIGKVSLAMRARKAAKAAKDSVLRKGALEGMTLPGKLADCQSKKREETELFVVEGDSAGGCWSGDTKVALADGRHLSFLELVKEHEEGKQNFCYTMQENGHIGLAPIESPRRTKQNADVIKVTLDTGDDLLCTPDHLFRLVDGSYIPAYNLTSSHSLAPLYRKISKKGEGTQLNGYEMVFDPQAHKWMPTHILADIYNLKKNVYVTTDGNHRHHFDFNKRNNNPTNIKRVTYEQHMAYHHAYIERTLHRPDVKQKSIDSKRIAEFRERARAKSLEKRELFSENAKRQWQDEDYKTYMVQKFLDYYSSNESYRKRNNALLDKAQREYWSDNENRRVQSDRVRVFFEAHPERKAWLSREAKRQWDSESLRAWRGETTRLQWTPAFREKRREAYNETYLRKALGVLHELYAENGTIDYARYNALRRERNDRSIIRHDTICERFFDGDMGRMEEAVVNYNHRIVRIERLEEPMDVYDLEVPGTHNFALASGVFVHNSAKMARDRVTQAILPLFGKVLNAERARLDKILASDKFRALVIALGTGIGEGVDLEKLRYGRIIIMADADVDGSHIKTLYLTFFYRQLRDIIERGHLYIAVPPLYKITRGKEAHYVFTDDEKAAYLKKLGVAIDDVSELEEEGEDGEGDAAAGGEAPGGGEREAGGSAEEGKPKKTPKVSVQRYKGLGEMSADELWETTMDPASRLLHHVMIEDAAEADKVFDILMGTDVPARKSFIQSNAKLANLDI